MAERQHRFLECQICGKRKLPGEVMPADLVRPAVADLIRQTHPHWSPAGFVCLADLDAFRAKYVQQVLETEKGELSALEEDVLRSLKEQKSATCTPRWTSFCHTNGRGCWRFSSCRWT